MDIITLLGIALPALITGAISYYFFKSFVQNENNRRNFLLHKETNKLSLPIKLQAYERITLFLERINPGSLLTRVKPLGEDPFAYASLLSKTIDQEYEHNLSQQIYIDEECWNVITTSKNSTLHLINEATKNKEISNAQELREEILKGLLNSTPPSAVALSYVKKEVQKII